MTKSTLCSIFKVDRMSKIIGKSQPDNACPVIDSAISDAKSNILDLKNEITELQELIDSSSDSETEIMEVKIERKENEISNWELEILNLENDRETISKLRSIIRDRRSEIYKELEDCIFTYNDNESLGSLNFYFSKYLPENSEFYFSEGLSTSGYYKIEKIFDDLKDWGEAIFSSPEKFKSELESQSGFYKVSCDPEDFKSEVRNIITLQKALSDIKGDYFYSEKLGNLRDVFSRYCEREKLYFVVKNDKNPLSTLEEIVRTDSFKNVSLRGDSFQEKLESGSEVYSVNISVINYEEFLKDEIVEESFMSYYGSPPQGVTLINYIDFFSIRPVNIK